VQGARFSGADPDLCKELSIHRHQTWLGHLLTLCCCGLEMEQQEAVQNSLNGDLERLEQQAAGAKVTRIALERYQIGPAK